MVLRKTLLGGFVLALAGCGAAIPYEEEYSCKGRPDGVTCKSAREVYGITNSDSDVEAAIKAQAEEREADNEPKAGSQSWSEKTNDDPVAVGPKPSSEFSTPEVARPTFRRDGSIVVADGAQLASAPFSGQEEFVAVRSNAVVLRVWVAPFETEDGDLIMPGYVFTEVEPRRWQFGNRLPRVGENGFLIAPYGVYRNGEDPPRMGVDSQFTDVYAPGNEAPGAAGPKSALKTGGQTRVSKNASVSPTGPPVSR